ncbi:Phosphatase tensin type [Penicillium subrubescens]|uniref:Phosphatase tensin type n=1 Tax=Penicillium subrubescens TaxID=1316194 RepID=UPI0025453DD7|nr:Phosphatase tensin type [Penicillium subrubescens]KAJ5912106.1 Phosphatase tensin type [Penicillium subrubescens]
MSSILRQIVAGPRLRHPEAGLDLCYVTDNIIATSGPSATYPQRAYRNPLDELVKFLDAKHGKNWCIWEFRAEGTGYPDSEVYNRIHHFPWPDHHPPPFALIPNIMGSMRNWLHRLDVEDGDGDKSASETEAPKRVAVVHCKAGKGRSGTIATSYLISQEGWKKEDALQRFTDRRMRVGFGNGVSIPSQMRYIGYVDRWANQLGKQYVERPVEILEIHIWGLRDGVKVAVEGYVDEGKKIKCFHMFHRKERTVVEAGDSSTTPTSTSTPTPLNDKPTTKPDSPALPINTSATLTSQSDLSSSASELSSRTTTPSNLSAVIFRPNKPIILPNSDVNIDFERRSKASYTGFAMVTSVAHVWFNAFFEGGAEHDSGVFETEWDAMDGIKGSARKGIRAFEKLKVVWRYSAEQKTAVHGRPISEPKPGEPVHESGPADWRGKKNGDDGESESVEKQEKQENIPPSTSQDVSKADSDSDSRTASKTKTTGSTLLAVGAGSLHELERQLGLRKQTDESKDVSLAGSDDEARVVGTDEEGRARKGKDKENGDLEGVQSYFSNGGGQGEQVEEKVSKGS